MSPGIKLRPPRSMTLVSPPMSLSTSELLPTIMILPCFTATASAIDSSGSTVTILPRVRARSTIIRIP